MNVFGLIGYPLTHSFSKKYFDEKFEKENIASANFKLFELENIAKLKDVLQQENELKGFAITIPYKEQIIPYLQFQHQNVGQIQACNCVKIIDGKLHGFNTDVIGFEKMLLPLLNSNHSNALVLGTGGAAKAVQFVLEKLKIEFKYVSRNAKEKQLSYEQVNKEVIQHHTLIINCTPLGTFPKTDKCPTIPYEHLTAQHLLIDLVYNPPETMFMKQGLKQGATVCNGYEMLVLQAEENWKIWSEIIEN